MLKELQVYCVLCLCLISVVYGYGRFREQIPNGMNVTHPCSHGTGRREIWNAVGHASPNYVPEKNVFGLDWRSNNFMWSRVCRLDSDGDGLTNGEELGDPTCTWTFRGPNPRLSHPLGHPGFCEPHRQKCDRGSNICGGSIGGGGRMRTPPPEANDHPQSFLSKQLGGGFPGRMGPQFGRTSPPRMRVPQQLFRGGAQSSIFGPAPRQTVFLDQSQPRVRPGGFDQGQFRMTGGGSRPQVGLVGGFPTAPQPRVPVQPSWDPRTGPGTDMWRRTSMPGQTMPGQGSLRRQVQDRMQRVRMRMQSPQQPQFGGDFFSFAGPGRGGMTGVSGVSGISGFGGPSGFK